MQGTADFHHQIADARLPQSTRVMDDAAALDAAVDVLDAHAPAGDAAIRGFLGAREGPAPGLPRVGMMISTRSSMNARKPRS
jgi:hypothetical protein